MHPPEEDHQFNRILASFSPLSYQQQDIALCTMVSKDQYDTIPSEDTTLLQSSLTPPEEDNHRSNRRNRLTTFGAAILVIIGLSVVAKSFHFGCPHKMPAFQAVRGGNVAMSGLDETAWVGDEPTLSPTLSPTVSPTVSPTISPTVSPTVSPTLSPTVSPVAK